MREIQGILRGKTVQVRIDCLTSFTQSDARDIENEGAAMIVDMLNGNLRECIIKEAAQVCRDYAHTDLKPSQMRRQVAYACETRILKLLVGLP